MSATVVLSGATGLVGRRLVRALVERGDAVRALTRSPRASEPGSAVSFVGWDGRRPPAETLRDADAVIHLAGEPIFGGLPTAGRRARIRDSRIESTRALVAELGELAAERRPQSLICASAVGYYGDRGEELLSEDSPPGQGFLAELCRDWETAAAAAAQHDVRSVSLRIGVVLAAEGGALPLMARPFSLGLGGPLGDGRQWFPWIQADDLVALLLRVLDDRQVQGAVNAVAPQPVRNLELTRALARQLRRPALLRVPAFALRALLGDLAGELLGSRRVVPARAEALGFRPEHPDLASALGAELGGGGVRS